MRIIFLDSWMSTAHRGSGTAVGIRNLATALRRGGHRVEILHRSRGTASLPSRIAFNLGIPGLLTSEPPPDLVVGFDIDGFRWASVRPRGAPYIVGLKGIAADEARFAVTVRERAELGALAWLERRNARRADGVVVPSAYSAEVAIERYSIPRERIEIVPEPVDLEGLRRLRGAAPSRRSGRSAGPVLLSVARQYPRKDTETLLRALPHVRTAYPDIRLRVIGGGPELARLRSLAGALDLRDTVRFEGEVPEDAAVQRAYLEADLFCLPSRQEGFGIAFVEAMSAGLPVVAARAGAVPELIRDGETGLLVPPGDEHALAGAILHLLDDPGAARRMGEAAARAATAYDLDTVGERFVEAVGRLISRQPRPS